MIIGPLAGAPAAGLNTTSGSMVIANPAQTTTYTVTAVNSNGRCPVSTQVTVELEDFDDVLINNPVPDACNNGGFLTLSLPTGVGNYNYQWENENGDPIAGTFLVPNLSAGTYFLTLTDQTTGCIFESSAVVAAVGGIDAYVQNVVAPNCPGFADGSATVGDWNLTNPITVQWPASAGNQTGITASNLSSGNYDVTITDPNNSTCFDVVQVQIPSGTTIEANIIEAIDVDCPALGSLTASGEFGSGSYLYNWNTGQSGPTITGLDAGTYTVNILDTNNPGCLASTSFTIQDVSNIGPISAGTGLSNELNFGQGCGGANPSVNSGNPFLETVNNDCVPTGTVTNACGSLDLSQNPLYYTVQSNVSGSPDDDLDLAILPPSSGNISMMEAALYGPVNPACPQLTGGSFVDCSSTNDPSTGLQLSVPTGADGQVFIIIVDTEGTGTFAIQGTVPNPLPLELVEFDGRKLEDQSHLLSWKTQLEVGVSHFQLERSDDSRTFETLGSKQEARNLLDVQEYEQLDVQPLIGPNYYRLQMVDFDGSMAYSPIILLDRKLEIGDEGVQVTPNPTMSISWLRIDNPIQGNLEFTVYNAIGQKIIHDQVNLKPGLHQFPIDLTEQADGTYWIQVQLESYRKH